MTCLLVLMQSRQLKVARALPEADILIRELNNLRVKVTGEESLTRWINPTLARNEAQLLPRLPSRCLVLTPG